MQIGTSIYTPKYCNFKRFLNENEFNSFIAQASTIICHGGEGILISSLRLGKKVIPVPRQVKFKEHLDDHQFQLCNALFQKGFVSGIVFEIKDLGKLLRVPFELKNFHLYSEMRKVIESFIYLQNENG